MSPRAPGGVVGPHTPGGLVWLERAAARAERVAVADREGEHTYGELLRGSGAVAATLLDAAGVSGGSAADLAEARVAFMAPPGVVYAAALWGIWRAGGIALPLCSVHPPPELAYAVDDAGATLLLAHPGFEGRLAPLAQERGVPLLTTAAMEDDRAPEAGATGAVHEERGAMILYTSGTTGRPKGVLHTHRSLRAQVESLVAAWAWSPEDRILHALPLHHTHGIVNAFLCALWSGAVCEMLPGFDPEVVWSRFAAGVEGRRPSITLFMAVPTIYVKLIAAWEAADRARRERWSAGARSTRLMVSGSAALPEATFHRWREITGHDLLERYGMTEIGMALSNPLHGERRPGSVGRPLPGVRIRLVGEEGEVLAEEAGPSVDPAGVGPSVDAAGVGPSVDPAGVGEQAGGEPLDAAPPPEIGPGEVEVRGAALFRAYWNRPGETRAAFRDGWFRTGDVAAIADGYWRILGRSSVDIIKSGGYKLSALEIEEVLRGHPAVEDCAVVGVPDREWGERVAAAVVPVPEGPGAAGALAEALDAWARARLAAYKVPRRWLVLEELPRNEMGKVAKPALQRMFRQGLE